MERGGSPPQPVVAPTGVPPPEFIRQEGIEGNPSPQRLQTESHSIVSNYTVHGILRARILEWVAFPFSRGSSQSRNRIQVSHIAGGFFTS